MMMTQRKEYRRGNRDVIIYYTYLPCIFVYPLAILIFLPDLQSIMVGGEKSGMWHNISFRQKQLIGSNFHDLVKYTSR